MMNALLNNSTANPLENVTEAQLNAAIFRQTGDQIQFFPLSRFGSLLSGSPDPHWY